MTPHNSSCTSSQRISLRLRTTRSFYGPGYFRTGRASPISPWHQGSHKLDEVRSFVSPRHCPASRSARRTDVRQDSNEASTSVARRAASHHRSACRYLEPPSIQCLRTISVQCRLRYGAASLRHFASPGGPKSTVRYIVSKRRNSCAPEMAPGAPADHSRGPRPFLDELTMPARARPKQS